MSGAVDLAKLEAECLELAPDFRVEVDSWSDPREPETVFPLVRATATVAGKPVSLELIATPALGVDEAGARETVVLGMRRTLGRFGT